MSHAEENFIGKKAGVCGAAPIGAGRSPDLQKNFPRRKQGLGRRSMMKRFSLVEKYLIGKTWQIVKSSATLFRKEL